MLYAERQLHTFLFLSTFFLLSFSFPCYLFHICCRRNTKCVISNYKSKQISTVFNNQSSVKDILYCTQSQKWETCLFRISWAQDNLRLLKKLIHFQIFLDIHTYYIFESNRHNINCLTLINLCLCLLVCYKLKLK